MSSYYATLWRGSRVSPSGGVHDHIWCQSSVRRIGHPTACAAVREPHCRGGTLRGARCSAVAERSPDMSGTSRELARSALDSHGGRRASHRRVPRPRGDLGEFSGTRAAGLVRSAGRESGVAPTRSVGLRLCHRTPYNASSNTRGCRRVPNVIVHSLRRAQATVGGHRAFVRSAVPKCGSSVRPPRSFRESNAESICGLEARLWTVSALSRRVEFAGALGVRRQTECDIAASRDFARSAWRSGGRGGAPPRRL